MRWDLLGVVFRKEVVDSLRDRRTLAMVLFFPVFGPIVLASTLSLVSRQARDVDEKPLALPVVAPERAPNLMAFLAERDVEVKPAPADPAAAVRSGDADVVLEIPEDHGEALRAARPAPLKLYLDQSRQAARPAAQRIRSLLESYSHRIGVQRLVLRGVHPAATTALAIEEVDLATPQSRAALLLSTLPYFLVVALFIGGMSVAIDATAGERERQSLEMLLLHPVPRSAVVLGKLAAAAAFSAVALVETTIGFALVPHLVPMEQLGFSIRLDPAVLARIVVLMAPLLLLVCAFILLVASRARTFRAAQSSVSFMMLVPATPGIVLALVPIKLKLWMLLVPAFGEQLLVNRMLRGEPVEVAQLATCMGSTLLWAALVAALAVRAFQDEKFLFGKA
jgi:sodium transport system permease protein